MRTLVLASAVATLLSASALAQNDPSLENCVKYAEADSKYELATRDAKAKFSNMLDEAYTKISDRQREALDNITSIRDQAFKEYHKDFGAAYEKYHLAVEKLLKKEMTNANVLAARDKLKAERDVVIDKITEQRDAINNDPKYSFEAEEAMLEKFRVENRQASNDINTMYHASVKGTQSHLGKSL